MRIPLTEPIAPRFIHINSKTNKIHILVRVTGGIEISTENTCQANFSLNDFSTTVFEELNNYKDALTLDIQLLDEKHPLRLEKEDRLDQIEAYVEALQAMKNNYRKSINKLLQGSSNLYGIQLRPRSQDSQSTVVNPAFNIERKNEGGTPLSSLYNAIYKVLPNIICSLVNPRNKLLNAVIKALPKSPKFQKIQQVLHKQFLALFGLSIDFTRCADSTKVTQKNIDALMGFDKNTPPKDYINVLIGACAPNIWESMEVSPFYNLPEAHLAEKTECLSIMIQFFLGIANVYCRSKGISQHNFGKVLDASPILSDELVSLIVQSYNTEASIEANVCNFFNNHAKEFNLSRSLNKEDITAIEKKFAHTYLTVTGTKENPHMDDFLILDTEASGENAKFVTHQGSICVDFVEIVDAVAASAYKEYFAAVRADFVGHPIEIPHKNEWVANTIEIEPAILVSRINNEQLKKLPEEAQKVCRPLMQVQQFLQNIARGQQVEAENILTKDPANTQTLLRSANYFTDMAGRTFNCTAYEYAYWAKDIHMCRMLESHMDDETKSEILIRIKERENIDRTTRQAPGLNFQQQGLTYHSTHFDISPLRQALEKFIHGYKSWDADKNWEEMRKAWLNVGKAQRDLPAHVLQEYCRPDRRFYPTPQFNDFTLPRSFIFYNPKTNHKESLLSNYNALGKDFAAMRGNDLQYNCARGVTIRMGEQFGNSIFTDAEIDLEAIKRLDEARNFALKRALKDLKPQVFTFTI